jgi:hypothetical protein
MSERRISAGLLFAAIGTFAIGPALAAGGFSDVVCRREYNQADVSAIAREVFHGKYERLIKEKGEQLIASGVIRNEFIGRNDALKFAVCDNPGAFDTLSVYGTGVAFDAQLLGLLMAQARALIAGATIRPGDQLYLHSKLMDAFIKNGATLNINPIKQVEQDALANGATISQYNTLLSQAGFFEREQNLFLVALNFLSLHERCHFGLDHGSTIEEIRMQPKAQRPVARYALELAADKCAIDIINADEADYSASPISYLGLGMTVATQTIVSAHAREPEMSSHPSSSARMTAAQAQMLKFISEKQIAGTQDYEKYRGTIEGFGAYMTEMIQRAHVARASRSKVPAAN